MDRASNIRMATIGAALIRAAIVIEEDPRKKGLLAEEEARLREVLDKDFNYNFILYPIFDKYSYWEELIKDPDDLGDIDAKEVYSFAWEAWNNIKGLVA